MAGQSRRTPDLTQDDVASNGLSERCLRPRCGQSASRMDNRNRRLRQDADGAGLLKRTRSAPALRGATAWQEWQGVSFVRVRSAVWSTSAFGLVTRVERT